MATEMIVLAVCVTIVLACVMFLVSYVKRTNSAVRNTQSIVTDKELIEFVNKQPDKLVNAKMLTEEFGLHKFEAKSRMNHLLTHGICRPLVTKSGMSRYYTLVMPIENTYDLKLTDDEFMTVEDLILIFKHNDYQVTLQELCLCTGLPVKVLLEEMKYFEKEKVVRCLYKTVNAGFSHQKVYTLREPYRSKPEAFMELKDVNFELKDIYEKVKRS